MARLRMCTCEDAPLTSTRWKLSGGLRNIQVYARVPHAHTQQQQQQQQRNLHRHTQAHPDIQTHARTSAGMQTRRNEHEHKGNRTQDPNKCRHADTHMGAEALACTSAHTHQHKHEDNQTHIGTRRRRDNCRDTTDPQTHRHKDTQDTCGNTETQEIQYRGTKRHRHEHAHKHRQTSKQIHRQLLQLSHRNILCAEGEAGGHRQN
eukprot:2628646-Alexandrium_andersonii.AAC.1